jgi:hypothetical protein
MFVKRESLKAFCSGFSKELGFMAFEVCFKKLGYKGFCRCLPRKRHEIFGDGAA